METSKHSGLEAHQPPSKYKTALLTGCGSKFGKIILNQVLHRFDRVDLITGNKELKSKGSKGKLHIHHIDWRESLEYFMNYKVPQNKDPYSLVFFNHNTAPQGFGIDDYYKDVLWTQEIINSIHLHADIKIGWMITAGIISPPDWFEYSPYFHHKHSRLYLMYFMQHLHKGSYFAIDPGEPTNWTREERKQQAIRMANFMEGNIPGATIYKAVGGNREPEFNWKLDWVKEEDFINDEDPFIYD
jgi:hypothetical protein